MPKKYYREIDILKGFAICLVLLGHSIIVYPINLSEIGWCNFLHNLVSTIHLPLFFLISGFCYSFKNYKDFLKKKTMRIFVPYFVFCLIGIIPNLFFSSLINGNQDFNLLYYFFDIFFIGSNVWFLYTLFIIFLIFPLIEKLLNNKIAKYVTLLVLLGLHLFPIESNFLSLYKLSLYLIYFVLGYLLKKYFPKVFYAIDKLDLSKRFTFLLVFMCLWISAFLIEFKIINNYLIMCRIVLFFDALFALVFFFILSNLVKDRMIGNIFSELGKYTLQLFVFNGYLLTISRTILVKVLGITTPFVIILINFLVLTTVSYCITRFIVTKVKLFRVLTGIV